MPTQRERVLAMLREGPQTTSTFLQAHLPRFSARIEELRKEGHQIVTRRVRQGEWQYTLHNFTVLDVQRELHAAEKVVVMKNPPNPPMPRLFDPPAVSHHHYDGER